ncbi:MAG: biopolymer transporter ExbD [bacterium]
MRHRSRRTVTRSELNVTSLVDVALALVIGFIVSIPLFFETGIFVSAPGVSQAGAAEEGSDIKANIYVDDDGRILLNEDPVAGYEDLAELLPRLLQRSLERKVVISSGELVKYDMVVRILDIAKQSGAGELALLRRRRVE